MEITFKGKDFSSEDPNKVGLIFGLTDLTIFDIFLIGRDVGSRISINSGIANFLAKIYKQIGCNEYFSASEDYIIVFNQEQPENKHKPFTPVWEMCSSKIKFSTNMDEQIRIIILIDKYVVEYFDSVEDRWVDFVESIKQEIIADIT